MTCFVDTTPLFVKQPTDDDLRQRLFHPKYGGCVYKIQVAVNFLGWICYWSGPHEGNINDNVSKRVLVQSDCGFVQVIYAATLHEHPLRSWEFWCGDGIDLSFLSWCGHSIRSAGREGVYKSNGGRQYLDQPLPSASRACDGEHQSTRDVQAEIQRIEGYVDSMHHTDDAHDVCQDQTRLG